jgi:hypothetical protein
MESGQKRICDGAKIRQETSPHRAGRSVGTLSIRSSIARAGKAFAGVECWSLRPKPSWLRENGQRVASALCPSPLLGCRFDDIHTATVRYRLAVQRYPKDRHGLSVWPTNGVESTAELSAPLTSLSCGSLWDPRVRRGHGALRWFRPTRATDHQVRYGTSDGSADGLLMPATVHADTSDKRMRSDSCSTMVPAT